MEDSRLALEQFNDSIIRTLNTAQSDAETDGKAGKSKCHNFLLQPSGNDSGLGAGPVNLPTTSADQQF